MTGTAADEFASIVSVELLAGVRLSSTTYVIFELSIRSSTEHRVILSTVTVWLDEAALLKMAVM